MRNAYAAILGLYPAEYRKVFAAEMLNTFEQAAANWRARGALAFLCFAGWELTGLLQGAMSEWIAKQTGRDEYSRSYSQWQEERERVGDAAAIEKRVHRLVRQMEFAIARYDFPQARRCSAEERVAREELERLLVAVGR